MSLRTIFDNVKALLSIRPTTLTASSNGTGVDTQGYLQGMVVLETGLVSGTSPTMSVKLQESDDNSTFVDIAGAVFATVTASNNSQVLRIRELNVARKRYLRAVATIGGTTPSFSTGVEFLIGDGLSGPANDD